MKAILLSTVFLAAGLVPAASQTPTAVIVPQGYTQFSDANGKPLADGTVYFYMPGTTTPKTTWQDPYQSVANPNPVVLNGSGAALVWGAGIYRQVVYDVNGNLIWDQLTGGYNCVGGGTIPLGANGALQYNNNGIFGGLPLGSSGQVLLANPSGPPTWGPVPSSGLPGGTTGTGPVVLQNSPVINTPTINGGSLEGVTLDNPTVNGGTINGTTLHNVNFTGTVTGLPGASCTLHTGGAAPMCIGTSNIIDMEFVSGVPPEGGAVNGFGAGFEFAFNVYATGTMAMTAATNIAEIPHMESEIQQLATHAGVKLK